MYTNSCMTIFNKHTTADKEVIYIPHKIDNVFWDSSEAVAENLDRNDEVVVYIPFEKNDLSDYISPKDYDEQLTSVWTIREGDLIIKGDLTSLESVHTLKELKDYETFTVYSIDTKDFGSEDMQHFKVKGK